MRYTINGILNTCLTVDDFGIHITRNNTQKTIPFSEIVSIELTSPGALGKAGSIFFYTSESTERYFLYSKNTDSRFVGFRGESNYLVAQQIKSEIDRMKCSPSAIENEKKSPITQNVSATDEIKKFKELLDIGAITQDEYNAKKAELLSK